LLLLLWPIMIFLRNYYVHSRSIFCGLNTPVAHNSKVLAFAMFCNFRFTNYTSYTSCCYTRIISDWSHQVTLPSRHSFLYKFTFKFQICFIFCNSKKWNRLHVQSSTSFHEHLRPVFDNNVYDEIFIWQKRTRRQHIPIKTQLPPPPHLTFRISRQHLSP
jgi:hypothetical protein